MPRVTIKDIATAAGVSLGTASRALSGNGSVAPATRDRVLDAARRLEFVPNAHARSLRSERTGTIGLLIPDVRNPFFAHLAHVIEDRAHAEGLSVLLCSAGEDSERMQSYAQLLRQQRVDGIIMAPFHSGARSIDDLLAAGIPLTFVDRMIEGLAVPAVVSDTADAVAEAVRSLAASGARRIGCISGPLGTSTGTDRLREFSAAAHGLPVETLIAHGDFQEESGRSGLRTLLDEGADAVLAADSLMTLGAVHECRRQGIVPGRDLPMIGFDDIPPLALLDPPLPLICQDIDGMGTAAVDLLTAQLGGSAAPEPIRIPAHLRLSVLSNPSSTGRSSLLGDPDSSTIPATTGTDPVEGDDHD